MSTHLFVDTSILGKLPGFKVSWPDAYVNANLLRRWVRDAEMKPPSAALGNMASCSGPAPEHQSLFVPVRLPAPAGTAATIRIELQRGATAVTVTWPANAAGECAAWMRELLR